MVELDLLLPATLKRRIHRLLGNRIELTVVRGCQLDPIHGELHQVEQVILDMAVLARAAMPFGGKLLLESANIDLADFAAGDESLQPGRYVLLEMTCLRQCPAVEMDIESYCIPAALPLDNVSSSIMPEARSILESLGGAICEYNEPGRALTMRAFFPSAAQVVYSDEQDKLAYGMSNQDSILLVEDEGYVRDVACEILESAGYKVLTAKSGLEALEIFREQGPVRLLVTDVVMPGMDGRDLAERLTSLQPELKTIYMSGYTDNAVLRLNLQRPDVVYIQKPFTLDTLTTTVKDVLQAGA